MKMWTGGDTKEENLACGICKITVRHNANIGTWSGSREPSICGIPRIKA